MASKIRFGRFPITRAMRRAFALVALVAAAAPAHAEPRPAVERSATAIESAEAQRSWACGPKRPRTSPRCTKSPE